jgi:hypothetical protein
MLFCTNYGSMHLPDSTVHSRVIAEYFSGLHTYIMGRSDNTVFLAMFAEQPQTAGPTVPTQRPYSLKQKPDETAG